MKSSKFWSFIVLCALLIAMVLTTHALPAAAGDEHTHHFVITVGAGNDVTVKCTTEGCSYVTGTEYTASLTILANKTYDGTPAEIAVSKPEGFPEEIQFTTQYKGRPETAYPLSPDAPKNAGSYTAITTIDAADSSQSAGAATASVDYSIEKAELTATYQSETIAEGATPALAVNVEGFVNGETAETETAAGLYSAPTVPAPASVEAGQTYYLMPEGGTATNYTFNYASGDLTVAPNVTINYTAGEHGSVTPPSETVSEVAVSATGSTARPDTNYVFVNWTSGESVVGTNATFVPSPGQSGKYEAATYKANFAERKATITYEAGTGGTVSSASEQVDCVTGTPQGSTATAVSGYSFVNWTADGEEVSTDPAFTPTKAEGEVFADVTYKANFEEQKATITYVKDGGGKVDKSSETIYSRTGTPEGATATADEGYTFIGWKDIDGKSVSTEAKLVPSKDEYSGRYVDATYIAVFQKQLFTIKLDLAGGKLNGATGVIENTCAYGSTFILPTPTKDGYEFDYWEGSKYNAGESYVVKEAHTFTAVWKEKTGGDTGDDTDKASGNKAKVNKVATVSTVNSGKTGSSKTGDAGSNTLWIILLIASIASITLIVALRREHSRQ